MTHVERSGTRLARLAETRAAESSTGSVLAVALLVALGVGACGTGQQLAAGPVVRYVAGRGWEAGGGPMSVNHAGGGRDPTPTVGSPLARASVGMSWRPLSPGSGELERITYAAWEPWLLAGGTLGVAHSSRDAELHLLGGAWEAVPYVFGAPGRTSSFRSCAPCYTVSLALGWRWGAASEFYLSPKVGILNDVTMPWPFQRYAD